MKTLDFREAYNIVGGTLLWAEEGLSFAPGMGDPSRVPKCPISISITLMRKFKKLFQKRTGFLSTQ
jgi:hypothetical protein